MVRQVFSSAIFAALAAPAAVVAQSSPMPMDSSMPMSGSTSMKMPACKTGDAVVWVNAKSKTFYMSGAPMYGKGKGGKYVCQSAAVAAGEKPAGTGAMGSPAPGGMMASPGSMASTAPGPTQTGGTTETNAQPNTVNSSSPSP